MEAWSYDVVDQISFNWCLWWLISPGIKRFPLRWWTEDKHFVTFKIYVPILSPTVILLVLSINVYSISDILFSRVFGCWICCLVYFCDRTRSSTTISSLFASPSLLALASSSQRMIPPCHRRTDPPCCDIQRQDRPFSNFSTYKSSTNLVSSNSATIKSPAMETL